MSTRKQLEILSKETIKPSSPTPTSLKVHNFSIVDQVAPNIYVPLLFFYQKAKILENGISISQLLKSSLSKILSIYYPFAGRQKEDQTYIDCNDEGVTFIEAIMKCELSEILKSVDIDTLQLLSSDNSERKYLESSSPLMAILITFFDCGGMTLSIRVSHKLADMSTFITFINNWAFAARNDDKTDVNVLISPRFDIASMVPTGNYFHHVPEQNINIDHDNKYVTTRYLFDGSKISALKAIVSEKIDNPSRVEVLTALLYKTIIISSLNPKPTTLLQAVNFRSKVVPPLNESSSGNHISLLAVEGSRELEGLVASIKQEMDNFCSNYAKKYMTTEEWFSLYLEHLQLRGILNGDDNRVLYTCSSWSRFGFYKADFGWGNPMWVSPGDVNMFQNSFVMIDTKDGDGIEVYVTLEEKHMAVFECNEEFLSFASLNPSPLK